MTSLSRRFTAALCASTMALSISPAFAHASNTAASDDSATSSTSIPGYPRDEFGGLRSKTSDKWGMPNQGVGPIQTNFPAASKYSKEHNGTAPKGVNDFSCKPKYKDALPIILIPGTNEDAYATWAYYGPMLTKAGLCAYTFNYNPGPAIPGALVDPNKIDESFPFNGDIKASAQFLGVFVNYVMKRTGAKKVDFVGHSQGGGALPNAYIKWYGGDKTVRHTIGLVASNHGSSLYGIGRAIDAAGLNDQWQKLFDKLNLSADGQQTMGSDFVKELEKGGITMPGVKYTVITTYLDDVVTPYTHDLIKEPGVTNIIIQDLCTIDLTDHFGMTYDPVTYQVVENMLTGRNYKQIKCTFVPPYLQ